MGVNKRAYDDGCEQRAHHAAKPLLPRGVPELQPDLDAVDGDLLGDEERAGGGGGVLGIELALRVSVKKTGLAHTCATCQRLRGNGEVEDVLPHSKGRKPYRCCP